MRGKRGRPHNHLASADYASELEVNAMDSLVHAVEHYLQGEKDTDLKYAILHVHQAVELFLKARLAKAHFLLIFQKPEDDLDKALTVDFRTAVKRLDNVGVALSPQNLEDLNFLRTERNAIEHLRFNRDHQHVEEYVARALRFLDHFLEFELGIKLKERLEQNMYSELVDTLYTYEQRIQLANERIAKALPSDVKEQLAYRTVICDECGNETVLVPDPTSDDERVRCSYCDARFYTDQCESCSDIILSAAPFDRSEPLFCDLCWHNLRTLDDD